MPLRSTLLLAAAAFLFAFTASLFLHDRLASLQTIQQFLAFAFQSTTHLAAGFSWDACLAGAGAFLSGCNWHLNCYAVLGSSLLLRARLAQSDHRPDQARELAFDGLLHVMLALLATAH